MMQHINRLPFLRRFSRQHPVCVITLTTIIFIASIIMISISKFDTDVTRLIPLHAEKTALYFRILKDFGGMEKAYIVFSSDNIRNYLSIIDRIGEEIKASGFVTDVEWKLTDKTKAYLRNIYSKKAPLLLSDEEMEDFIRRLTPEGIEKELKKTKQRLNLPGNPDMLAMMDPLNFSEIFSAHMKISEVSFDYSSGYYITPDGKKLIMILSPEKTSRDITFSRSFIDLISQILKKNSHNGLQADITGSHAITLHEATVMKKEIITNILTSFISVMIIFFFFFRSLKGLLYVILPVILSVIITNGTILLFSHSLSEVTGAFAGLIAGLGIDLGIILYARYLLNIVSNPDRKACMDLSISEVYRGITTGIFTTALTFIPMLLSSFKGIRELGLLTGIGIIYCWIFLLSFVSVSFNPTSGRFLEIKLLGEIAYFSYKRPLSFLIITALSSFIFVIFIPRLTIIGDITKLGTKDNRARNILEELKGSVLKEHGIFITETTEDFEHAIEKSHQIKKAISPYVKNTFSIADIIPPLSLQKRNLERLKELNNVKIIKDFELKAKDEGFDLNSMKTFIDSLRLMINNRDPITLKDVEPLHSITGRFIRKDGDRWEVLISGNAINEKEIKKIRDLRYTGSFVIRQELLNILKRDIVLITIAGLLMVNIALYLDFKNIYHVLLCQLPVAISITITLGFMGMTGISLNFMNLIVFALLFGIGTDYTVHILHRYYMDYDIKLTFNQTGKAVLVAGLTTIASFGSIAISSYQGLASIGQIASIGTVLCLLFSFILIPAMLRLHENSKI